MVTFKKIARDLAYRKRHLALTSIEQVQMRKLKRIFLIFCIRLKNGNDDKETQGKIRLCMKVAAISYLRIAIDPTCGKITRALRNDRTIASFDEANCRINFRYLKPDLFRLLSLLKFPTSPESFELKDGSVFTGEEVFLRGLYEMVSGENQHKICANVFGRTQSRQSKAFTLFINHIYDKFHHLVHDNLDWWYRNGFHDSFAKAIEEKMIRSGYELDCEG